MTLRVLNFSGGPGELSAAVLALVTRWLRDDVGGLDGHRSIGGLRASLYNAVTPAAVETLCDALIEFSIAHA